MKPRRQADQPSVPRLLLVAARSAFDAWSAWERAVESAVAAALSLDFEDVSLQVRIEEDSQEARRRARRIFARLRTLDTQHRIPLFLNARVPAAMELGYDGTHLTEAQWLSGQFRQPYDLGLSASIHSPAALRRNDSPLDYVVAGSIWPPSWKTSAVLGLDGLAGLVEASKWPIVAIGGIKPAGVGDCLAAGAHGVAVVSGVFGQPDIRGNLRRYQEALRSAV